MDSDVGPLILEPAEEDIPDLGALFWLKRGIVDYDMDARDEGVVKGSHAVTREEQNSLIVLQGP